MDGWTHGRRQNYIPPTSSGDNNVVCANSKASDQPAHTRSLIRAYASRLNILLGVSQLKRRLNRLVRVYTCQNATMLETTCHGSYNVSFMN